LLFACVKSVGGSRPSPGWYVLQFNGWQRDANFVYLARGVVKVNWGPCVEQKRNGSSRLPGETVQAHPIAARSPSTMDQ
jgi:hypothetical protein